MGPAHPAPPRVRGGPRPSRNSKARLRELAREGGIDPPEEELDEVAEFFGTEGEAALPKLRAAMDELVRRHRRKQGGT